MNIASKITIHGCIFIITIITLPITYTCDIKYVHDKVKTNSQRKVNTFYLSINMIAALRVGGTVLFS